MEQYNLVSNKGNLVGLLPVAEQNEYKNYLITSEIVYRMLSRRKDAAELYFSPALIPLTKAMELVLNLVFQRIPFAESNMDDYSKKYYFYNGNKKSSIEFGPCINLLKDSSIIFVNLNSRGDYVLSWGNNRFKVSGRSRFLDLNGYKVITFDRLKAFKGLSILIEPKPKQPAISVAFTNDTEHNRMLFVKGLEYVKNNYRNIVAYKDGISLQTVEDCRKILLQTESLLWILFYIINN